MSIIKNVSELNRQIISFHPSKFFSFHEYIVFVLLIPNDKVYII